MRKKKMMLVLLLAAMLVVGNLTGCNKTDGETVQGEVVEAPKILTNVYKGEDIELPGEEYSLGSYIGMDEGNIIFLASYFKEINSDPENFEYESWPAICYVPMDGSEPTFEKIEGQDWVNSLVLLDGGYMIYANAWDAETQTSSYSLLIHQNGEDKTVENLESFFPNSDDEYFWLRNIARDGDGYTYLFTDADIAILDPEYKLYANLTTGGNWVESIDTTPEGKLYISYYGDDGQVFAPIDRENKKIGEPLTLPDTIHANSYFFGEDYTVYYYNDTGIYGYNEGDTDGTLLMNFENSDITGDLDTVKALSDGKFLLEYYDRISWDRKMGVFTKADDIDLSQVTVLQIATVNGGYDLPSIVVNYNRNHTDTRIVTTDYSQYNTDEDYNAGNTKLANDILNGLYKPDLIYGMYTEDSYRAVIDNDRFVDLKPYLEKDAELPLSELMGCVTNTYQKDGKLFGLPMEISVSAVIANKSMVGDRTGWTLDELLDFIDSLPEGVSYMGSMTRVGAADQLLGQNGYGAFIDMENGTCSFDSETFIRYLEYLKTLPKELPDDYWNNYYEDQYGPTKRGEVAAIQQGYHGVYEFIRDQVYFGAGNVAYVGTPTADGSCGITLNTYRSIFTILSDSAHPEQAWDFIKSAILQVNSSESISGGADNLPMLRSNMEKVKEAYKDTTFVIDYSGGMSWGSSYTPNEEELKNGEAHQFTEADWDFIENFLDTIGAPMTTVSVPEDVLNIINEEMSSYLDGTKAAADCANMIQNRVGLYLAENS